MPLLSSPLARAQYAMLLEPDSEMLDALMHDVLDTEPFDDFEKHPEPFDDTNQ